MNPDDPNVAMLELVAHRLGDALRSELVFVGGAIAGLLITDTASPQIRPTEDVDMIVHTLALTDYRQIERALERQGFTQDLRQEAPICRWTVDGVTVDIMPTIESVLGFSNQWYPYAIRTSKQLTLPSGGKIRVISAVAFLATKLEAFSGRGNQDYLFSHDLGDVLALIDGRESLINECRQASAEIQNYLSEKISALMATGAFRQALPGHLPGDMASQERVPDLEDKLVKLSQLR